MPIWDEEEEVSEETHEGEDDFEEFVEGETEEEA